MSEISSDIDVFPSPQKTPIMAEEELWKRFLIFTIEKTGSSRRVSDRVEDERESQGKCLALSDKSSWR